LLKDAAEGYAELVRGGLPRKAAATHRDVQERRRHVGASARGCAAASATSRRLSGAEILPCDTNERHGPGLPHRHLPGTGHQTGNGLKE